MSNWTIESLDREIQHIYAWWAEEHPGITPQEEGRLARLWAEHDRLVEKEEQS